MTEIVTENYTLIHGEAIECMKKMPDKSIDMILCDLPYGTTQNKWDIIIPFEPMWEQYQRVIKENGAIVLTATQPFSSLLVGSNLKLFKYEMIWEKTISSGQLNVGHQPLRSHESILVFYEKIPTYNEQLEKGTPYSIKRTGDYKEGNYSQQKSSEKKNDGYRHARSVLKMSNPRIKNGHPTQKPLALMEHLIRIYTNENDVVLDCCMGHGTTGEAAIRNNRKFYGIELDKDYFNTSKERIEKAHDNFTNIKQFEGNFTEN